MKTSANRPLGPCRRLARALPPQFVDGAIATMLDELVRDEGVDDIERRVLERITEEAWLDLTCELVGAAFLSRRNEHWEGEW